MFYIFKKDFRIGQIELEVSGLRKLYIGLTHRYIEVNKVVDCFLGVF